MTKKELNERCHVLGITTRDELASVVKRSPRTVEKWQLGTSPVPEYVETILDYYERLRKVEETINPGKVRPLLDAIGARG